MRCNDARLAQLLSVDENSAEYESVANHVEVCAHCQQRLVELSGDNDLLCEVRETLLALGETEPYHASVGSSVVISIESNQAEEIGAECEPVSLDFLAPPSHPEMLGRIGRYEVERMIGSGGMGIVLKGFDTELHRVVAIKVLKPHLAHNGAARSRFAREAQSAAAVVHEHVIPIYDVQSDGEMPFLVMQYVPGQSLQTRVDERGPLDPKEVLRIARQAAAGLAAAHAQGLVHRDVKPANILMEESVERVLISDFGLARTVDDATLTRTGIVAGTPHYMSPEQASGHSVDHRSDLFSLGCVIYFMCTGRPPFRAEQAMAILNRICHDRHRPVDEINHDIPGELAEIVDQLLSKDPDDRFRTAHEVEQRLESILAQLQNGKRSIGLRWRRSWLRRRSAVTAVLRNLSIIAVCVLLGIGLAHWHGATFRSTETGRIGDQQSRARQRSESTAVPSQSIVGEQLVAQEFDPDASNAIPLDNFMNELNQVRSAVDAIDDGWNNTNTMASQLNSPSHWDRELNQIQTTIQDLEKGSPRSRAETQPFQTIPDERIER